MKVKTKKIDKEIEKAIIMLTDCVKEECRNQKPLILHSIRVGFKLLELEQPKEVIIAGILHDLVEDTNCTIKKIKKVFGSKVSNLVSVVTQNKEKDYKKRWSILMRNIKKVGKSAMIIKLADMNDNLTYISLIKDSKELKKIEWKQNFAMNELRPYLKNMNFFHEYEKSFKKLFKK